MYKANYTNFIKIVLKHSAADSFFLLLFLEQTFWIRNNLWVLQHLLHNMFLIHWLCSNQDIFFPARRKQMEEYYTLYFNLKYFCDIAHWWINELSFTVSRNTLYLQVNNGWQSCFILNLPFSTTAPITIPFACKCYREFWSNSTLILNRKILQNALKHNQMWHKPCTYEVWYHFTWDTKKVLLLRNNVKVNGNIGGFWLSFKTVSYHKWS